jgi:hypothetical protein
MIRLADQIGQFAALSELATLRGVGVEPVRH